MKTRIYIWCVALFSMFLGVSCSDDDHPANIPDTVKETLKKDYPNAGWVEWSVKAGYYVADFHQNGEELDVWYNNQAQWCMTETDFERNFTLLPSVVQDAYQTSGYASWRIDNIDKYECPDKTFYLIEIETKGERDRKLFYSDTGLLLKDVEDKNNDDVLPNISF